MAKYSGWKKRWAYLDDYKRGMNGEYVYYGTHYTFDGDQAGYRKYKIILGIADFVFTALFILSGLMNAGIIWNVWYVIVPFALEAGAVFLLIWKSFTIMVERNPVKTYIYKKSVPWFKPVAIALAVITLISVITTGISMLVYPDYVKTTGCILYMVIKLASAAAGIAYVRIISKYKWKPDPAEEA